MKKLIVSAVALFSFAAAPLAFAQSSCVQVPTLSVGSNGASVSTLQNFLVSRNYPGGGNWMITGHYGAATEAAVRLFQQEQNLPQTGTVDSATASAIANVSCGGYNYNTAGAGYTYPGYPGYTGSSYTNYSGYPFNTYPYSNWGYGYGAQPTITSLSQNTGYAGNSVTIYGTGFDLANNTVYFGSQTLYGVPSINGTSLTFTVPAYYGSSSYSFIGTSVNLSIGTSRGTSNSVSFTLYGGYSYGCGTYPYNMYSYNYYTQCNTNYPPSNPQYVSLSYLSPVSGGVGTSVTVYGTGFTTTGNTVRFGNGVISNLGSSDGRAVTFTVPSYLTGYGSQPITIGTYNVSVTNGIGVTSNALPFSVTSTGNSSTAPSITNVNGPTSLSLGQQGNWSLTINNPSGIYASVSVNWGDTGNGYVNMAAPQQVYGSGTQTMSFTHAYNQSGSYTITFTVTNSYGLSNSYTTTIAVGSGSQLSPIISYVSPTSGRVGTQVVITGTGFALYNNTVHFGNGGTLNVPSYNGTTLYYTIPATISPCDVIAYGAYCAQYLQQVTPGTYQISVSNDSGTSSSVSFNVTY